MVDTSAYKPRGSTSNKVKRYHGKNNVVVWQEHKLAHGQGMKEDIGWIKEEKVHTQAMSNPKKEWDIKNEDLKAHPRHKS